MTYCSDQKSEAPDLLSVASRYRSNRIRAVFGAAQGLGLGFMVLSGEFGLLTADDQIPYYDHLLVTEEVRGHSAKVAEQLTERGITDVVFFSNPASTDPLVVPYIDCMKVACEQAGVGFKLTEIDIAD